MASMFSAFNPSAYKTYQPNNVKGTFGSPSNVMSGGVGQQGNLMAIIDLIKKLSQTNQLQQPNMQQIEPGGQSGLQSLESSSPINLLKANFE